MDQAVLLRGINVGPRKRIAMPALRDALAARGFQGARTYVQSGNIVVHSDDPPEQLQDRVRALIEADFHLDVEVIVRTGEELAAVVKRNPLKSVATTPKLYQVTFLADRPDPETVRDLEALAVGGEQLVAHGRELYTWHPTGAARSKLWAKIAAAKTFGRPATTRNWSTVTKLLEMVSQ